MNFLGSSVAGRDARPGTRRAAPGVFSPVAEESRIPKQPGLEVTRGNGAKTERPMGRAFSPHGLWGDAPLSRGDTPGWYWTRRWRSKNGFCRGCRRVGARKTNALVVAVLTPGEKMRLGRAPVWGVCVLTSGKRMGMGIPGNVRNPRDGGPCWRPENEWGSPCTLVVLVDCTRLAWIAVLEGQRPGTIPAQAIGLGNRTKKRIEG